MPEQSDGSDGTSTTLVPNQLASLVPTFDPAKDDLTDYTKKVQLLMNMWPDGKWTELATRLILGCSGSAFQKLQLKSSEITANDKKSIQQIIELLGGQWGQIPLEKKYESAERALFRCSQCQDETTDSYLARADVLWQELLNKEIKLEELQAYITLRGSGLSAEDKKRVVIDSQVSTEGKLTMPRVTAAIRMLGAGFFHEITSGKKSGKLKTYDANTMLTEHGDEDDESSQTFHSEVQEECNEDEMIDALVQEGDTDAILVADFESAASDILQGDEELASALNAYTDARRRLSEKVKSRGFWPIAQSMKGKSKGMFRGSKGKFQKGHTSSRRNRDDERSEAPRLDEVHSSRSLEPQSDDDVMHASEHVPGETVKHDFTHLSMAQLEETKVDFGQAHVGRTYKEMWVGHQDWITWFVGRFEKSGKKSHQRLIHYVKLMIERAELTGTQVPVNKGITITEKPMTKAKAKPFAKKLANPSQQAAAAASVWDLEDETEFEIFQEEEFDGGMSVTGPEVSHPDVSHLETRMLNVENALTQILGMLEQFRPPAEDQ
eukprot:s628_g18.t1